MKKDIISYEIGVLMVMAHIGNDEKMADSIKTIVRAFDDEEIYDEYLLKGMRNELDDLILVNNADDTIQEILEDYELNIDLYPMEMEHDKLLNKFFEREELFIKLPNIDDHNLSYHEKFLYDDFKLARKVTDDNPNYHIYTVVDGDYGTAWLVDGWHFVNRQGYIFTTEKIDIPEEGLRYW